MYRIVAMKQDRYLGFLSQDKFDSLHPDLQNEILKYRRISTLIKRKENKLKRIQNELRITMNEIRDKKKEQTELWGKVQVFKHKYYPTVSVSKYKKNKSSYWNCTVRTRGVVKSIYLGSDKNVRQQLSQQFSSSNFFKMSDQELKTELLDVLWVPIIDYIQKDPKKFITDTIVLKDLI